MRILKLLTGLFFILLTSLAMGMASGINPLAIAPVLVALAFIPKPAGVLAFNFADMLWQDGEKNMGGVKTIGYYALAADIDEWPTLPAEPATAAQEVTYDGNFRMKSGKSWHKIYSTMETAFIHDEPQGEPDGQSFVNRGKIFYPGTKVEALAFAKNANNSNMVFILDEASGGNRRVIGNQGFPAKVTPDINTGEATADRKGMNLDIWSYSDSPALLYEGVIELESETIS